jgi:hypothetical protein
LRSAEDSCAAFAGASVAGAGEADAGLSAAAAGAALCSEAFCVGAGAEVVLAGSALDFGSCLAAVGAGFGFVEADTAAGAGGAAGAPTADGVGDADFVGGAIARDAFEDAAPF